MEYDTDEKKPLIRDDTKEFLQTDPQNKQKLPNYGSSPVQSTLYYSNSSSDMRLSSGRIVDQPVILNEIAMGYNGDDENNIVGQQSPQGDANSNDSDTSSNNSPLSHCHARHRDSSDLRDGDNLRARRTLIMASALCLVFMLAEFVGGYLAGSLAIMTDAAHLLTDFASFLISLFSLFVASRPATRRMSFGWHRAEVLGAFLSVIMIWIITGVLVYMAVERIINKTYEINATYMLITAAVGVFVNVVMGILLHKGGHGHSHGGGSSNHNHKSHTNGHTRSYDQEDWLLDDNNIENGIEPTIVRSETNINVRAAFIHVLGDFFQSVGVLIAAYVIYYHPELTIIDPICTFLFSAVVLMTTIAIMRDALNILMEGSPKSVDFGQVAETLAKISGVVRVHNLRIWSLTMDKVALSVHLAVGETTDSQEVLRTTVSMLRRRFGIFECTVQIEHYSNDMDECDRCENPKH